MTQSNNLKSLILAVTLITMTSACAKFSTQTPGQQNGTAEEQQEDTWVDAEIDSENLADEGEDLLAYETLDRAHDKFTEALKLDKSNARADIWSHFITSIKQLRGLVYRIQPFIESLPNGKQRYREMIESANGIEDKNYRNLLMTRTEGDITSAKEFQEWLDRANLTVDELRNAFIRHKSEEVRLLIPISFFGATTSDSFIKGSTGECETQSFGPIQIQSEDCSEKGAQVLLNRADTETIIAGLVVLQSYFALANAYQVDPKLLPVVEYADRTGDMSALAKAGIQLRSNTVLNSLDVAFQDLAVGVKYIFDHQSVACPRGNFSNRNRPGTLFPMGLCVSAIAESQTDRVVQVVDQLIARKPLTIWNHYTDKTVDIDIFQFFKEPPKNLNVFFPNSSAAPICEGDEKKGTIFGFSKYVTKGNLREFWTELRAGECFDTQGSN